MSQIMDKIIHTKMSPKPDPIPLYHHPKVHNILYLKQVTDAHQKTPPKKQKITNKKNQNKNKNNVIFLSLRKQIFSPVKFMYQDMSEFLSSKTLAQFHCLKKRQLYLTYISYKSVLLIQLSFELISAKGKRKNKERSLIFEGAYFLYDLLKFVFPLIHLFQHQQASDTREIEDELNYHAECSPYRFISSTRKLTALIACIK